MTNNDEMALKIEIAGINYALCKLLPDCRFMAPPDSGSVTPLEQVSRMIADYRQRIEAMLAERDADKKLIAEQGVRLVEYAQIATESARRVAEMEARTVSVKLLDCDYAAVQHMSGGSSDYCKGFVDGTQNAIKRFKADCAAAGIKLDVGDN